VAPKLIVVVNELLMDNHQLELAEELAKQSYLFYCYPKTVVNTIINANWSSIQPYIPVDKSSFRLLFNQEAQSVLKK
jgi:beta-1,4-N-acetylglucosaminyltransferase